MKLFGLNLNKDILILGLGNIPRFILLIVYTRLQTFFLDYENLSKFYLVFSIYTFFSFIIIGPVGTYVTRNILEWYKSNQINSGLKTIFLRIIIPIAIFALISISSLGSALEISSNSIYIALIIFFIIIAKTANELIFPVFNLIDKNLIYLSLVLIFHILNPVFSVVIIKIYEPSFNFWLIGLILSNLVVAIIGWNIISKLPQNNRVEINFKQLKSFSYYIMIGNILAWTLTDGFRFIAEVKIGLVNTGILILGLIAASQIFANIEVLMNQFLMPRYLQKIAKADYISRSKAFNNLLNVAIPLYFIIVIVTTQLSEVVLNVIIDKSKINLPLIGVFITGVWIEFLKIILNTLKNISTSEYKTNAIIPPFLIGAFILISGLFSNQFNSIGLIANLILLSYIFVLIASLISFNRIINIKFDFKFFIKKIWLIIVIYILFNFMPDYSIIINLVSVIVSISVIYSIIDSYNKNSSEL
jgi:hypothetical protein